MARVQVEVVGLEFEDGGNTLWVQGEHGTVLRIKLAGTARFRVRHEACIAPGAHGDMTVLALATEGDVELCVPEVGRDLMTPEAWATYEAARKLGMDCK